MTFGMAKKGGLIVLQLNVEQIMREKPTITIY